MTTLRGCPIHLPWTFPGRFSLRKSADRCHPYVHPEPTEDTMHRDDVREILGGEEPLDERLLVAQGRRGDDLVPSPEGCARRPLHRTVTP